MPARLGVVPFVEAAQLVRPGARGGAAALLASHRPRLLNRARRYSLCADDAEDALQRAALILLLHWHRIDPRRVVPWMLTVVTREALAVRRKRLRDLGSELPPEWDTPDPVPAGAAHPAERLEHREHLRSVARLLDQLKPHERRALTLQAQGYSYAEIQSITGWTHTKVNRCLSEGRARLRELRLGSG